MSNLMIFENKHVEVFEWNGQVFFNPKHVAECLDIADVNSSIRNFNEKQVVKLTNSKMHDMQFRKLHNTGENFLTESGVYKLIFKSHKPDAEKFQDWVTDEVLPTVRKTGGYVNNDELFINTYLPHADEQTKLMFRGQLAVIQNLNKRIEQDKPKVLFADAVTTSKTQILIGELAKLLNQNGVDIGQNRLFSWLRDSGYLIRRNGTDWNMPTQKSMDMDLFRVKETPIKHKDGHVTISKTVKVTGKGQLYFINLFLKKQAS